MNEHDMTTTSNCPRCNGVEEDFKVFQVFSSDYDKLCPACKQKAWKTDMCSFTIITSIGGVGAFLLVLAFMFSLLVGENLEVIIYMIGLAIILAIGVGLMIGGWLKKPAKI